MTGKEFIFSNKKSIRLIRHLVFWLACWLYGSLTYYFIQQSWMTPGLNPKYVSPGAYILFKTFLLVVVYTIPCYTFIKFILPALIKREWLKATVILIPLLVLMYGLGGFMYWNVFPFVDSMFGLSTNNYYPTHFWPAVVLGLVDPLKVIATAAIIKYAKYWWSTQKEKEELEQEKLNAELQLLKAQISPGFLFTTLDNIYEYALANSPQTPELLMKLSDLLSYMVYECEAFYVPLEDEIKHMQDFIALEKLRLNSNIEIGLAVNGNLTDKMIAPFLLLPFIEFGFKQCSSNPEQVWINMDISVTNDVFTMRLASGENALDVDILSVIEDSFTNVQKRLSLLYPKIHELKIFRESEMFIVLLKIGINPDQEEWGTYSIKSSVA